jgi:hypothetical protein
MMNNVVLWTFLAIYPNGAVEMPPDTFEGFPRPVCEKSVELTKKAAPGNYTLICVPIGTLRLTELRKL